MSDSQSPVCPICQSWMLIHPSNPEFLKCLSCGFCCKINKRIIKPVGNKK